MAERESGPRWSAAEISKILGAPIVGEPNVVLQGVAPLETATSTDLSFFSPTNKRQQAELEESARNSLAGAILVKTELAGCRATQIIVPEPLKALIQLATKLLPSNRPAAGVHPTAVIDSSAEIGEGVHIGAYVVIGARVVIGNGSVIHPHVVIYPGVKLGKECQLHAGVIVRENVTLGNDCLIQGGVVLGGDGFGYIPDSELGHKRIPHLGSLVLEDRVDIGANSTVDRATFGTTRICKAAKIDNLVMIGHNVRIGERTLLCGQVGISGSTKVGDDVILAGKVGVADHVSIGDRVRAAAKTGVTSDVPEGIDISGHPWMPAVNWRRMSLALARLPELFRRVKTLERSSVSHRNTDND